MFNDINIDKLISIIIGMSLFIISGSIHEFAHAFSAYIMGDDTAKYNGRLTINPMAHIDLFGSIIFPLFGMLSGFFFGWMTIGQILCSLMIVGGIILMYYIYVKDSKKFE